MACADVPTDEPALCPECRGTGRKEISPSRWIQCGVCKGNAPAKAKKLDTSSNWKMFYVVALYLIATFSWRALVTAHEYPRPIVRGMTMIFDALCLVGLFGLRVQISRANREAFSPATNLLFGLALLAGVGLFAIRLTDKASWATGHIHYDWNTPRPR
jgi:hypothetical protein